eukprot:TRINITY_DN5414_c0_g1_i1.p1 TRINITY_DN5414_c0_g1~~TRINITY_DN5414_c0_g1_i1.p1  ORF type:complete len:164 (-),score=9.05 TRINITY_DN5414_c0_g1_i1:56-547(-)
MASFSYNNVTWILGCLLAYFMTDILELYLFKIQKSYKVKLGHHGVEVRKVKKIDYHEKFTVACAGIGFSYVGSLVGSKLFANWLPFWLLVTAFSRILKYYVLYHMIYLNNKEAEFFATTHIYSTYFGSIGVVFPIIIAIFTGGCFILYDTYKLYRAIELMWLG